MIETIKQLLGFAPKTNYKELLANGAIIVDVRTAVEYRSGHIAGAINIPLQTLPQGLAKLNKTKTVITCCASGIRSASAKSILQKNGFAQVYNGGGWHGLQHNCK